MSASAISENLKMSQIYRWVPSMGPATESRGGITVTKLSWTGPPYSEMLYVYADSVPLPRRRETRHKNVIILALLLFGYHSLSTSLVVVVIFSS
jgi:hypothetical protein